MSRSRSPAIHAAAYRALGLAGTYEAFSVDVGGVCHPGRERWAKRAFDYLNVTIPYKREAAELADSAAPMVRTMAAANTLIFRGRGKRRTIRAENTDGYGLLTALADLGIRVGPGQLFVLVGSGGAAAGGLAALVGAGARVRLVARRPAAARALRDRFASGPARRIAVSTWTPDAWSGRWTAPPRLVSAVPASAWADAEAAAGIKGLRTFDGRARDGLRRSHPSIRAGPAAIQPLSGRPADAGAPGRAGGRAGGRPSATGRRRCSGPPVAADARPPGARSPACGSAHARDEGEQPKR